ncbi:hypothetical protein [Longimicrobium sp.]|uniref:hypothetical protein n=1 Tax=Longimicrobium sp. TaxID=2029185 RepID=UPI002E33860A|nr:hypothetical protein [Longimicrobium sp.]HEX6036661.1 hypothetical protein [Longimicrobium sp.]
MSVSDPGFLEKIVRYKQYLLVALLGGAGAVLFSYSKDPALSPGTAEDLREAAFAMLATALALFIAEIVRKGYEELLSTTVQSTLEENLRDVRLSKKLLTDLERLRDVETETAVSEVLSVKLGIDEDDRLTGSLNKMLDGLSALKESTHWAKDVYREYLVDVIRNTAQNTEALCALSTEKFPSQSGQGIKLTPSAQRTDEILAKLMSTVGPGSRYSVLSDLESWLGGNLETFFSSSRVSAEQGVLIRRIFVVLDADFRRRNGALNTENAFEVLGEHIKAQSNRQDVGYHVRLYVDHGPKAQLSGELQPMIKKHFGIFEPSHDDPCVQVRVEEPDLSGLRLINLPRNSIDQKKFEFFWQFLEDDLSAERLETERWRWRAAESAAS